MIRSRYLVLSCFLVGVTLNASAQQSTPAAPAPPPLVGTLARCGTSGLPCGDAE
jgi:hypothetical protein